MAMLQKGFCGFIIAVSILISSCETLKEGFSSLGNSLSSLVNNDNDDSESTESSGNRSEPEQVMAIKAKWQEYKPRITTRIFLEQPNIGSPYRAGRLTPEFLQNGLNTVNFIRYLAGLSENTIMTDELNDIGQHGAVLLAKVGHLTHTPSKPADMDQAFYRIGYQSTTSANIHQSMGTTMNLSEAVKGWCDDSDESNIDRLGHRRWILNPALGKIGFGYASTGSGQSINSFAAIQVFDKSNTSGPNPDYVLWPNQGYFPSSFFETTQAWSVSLNPDIFNLSRCNPTVKLTCINDGKEWVFTGRDKNKTGKYFNIERTGFGMPYCIIFRPDGMPVFLRGKKFKVEIGGLVDKAGQAQQLVYEVEFFSL
ncbi:MAG: CAP domain-containing protein [Spirochaetaceae bacterium]|jgi:uncharacterized protein YkwD|nr:CAP domain-containing protein [Spirochaetaceae bacterium]